MAKKSKIEEPLTDTNLDLASIIKQNINNKFKDKDVALFLDKKEEVSGWIPTGSPTLDIAISNQKHGGWPRGKIIELGGLEASGKSLLAAHAIKNAQKMGGIGVYIDTEHSSDTIFLEAIGVDLSKMVYIEMTILEDIYQTIEDILLDIQKQNKNIPVIIVFDSQSGAVALNEYEGDYKKEGWNTDKAIINSKAMRKITSLIGNTNAILIINQQLRVKLGCVNPITTNIIIRKKSYVKANKFTDMHNTELRINVKDFFNELGYDYIKMEINKKYDISLKNYEILTEDGKWNKINSLIRKPDSLMYIIKYENKSLEVASDHKILCKNILDESISFLNTIYLFENNRYKQFLLKHNNLWIPFHVDKTSYIIPIVDFELDGTHSYLSNDIVSHNTSFGDPYCVDPYTTKIKIRYKSDWKSFENGYKSKKYVEEEISIKDFSDKFANNDDFENPEIFEINPEFNCEILGFNFKTNEDVYKPIKEFIIKDHVESFYTDGNLNCSSNHRIWNYEINNWVHAKEHKDFKLVEKPLLITDFEIKDIHNYYANGRLNHNSTSGGHAIAFHASVRVRLKPAGQIKGKVNGVEQVIGITTKAQVKKNRCGPNLRTTEFNIYYDSGINEYENWLDTLELYGLIKKGGAWYTWIDLEKIDKNNLPLEHKFQRKTFEEYITVSNPHLKDQIYNAMADTLIMQYKSSELNEENIIFEKLDESEFIEDTYSDKE